jgi:tetratricopeptide (TPR) repeat protein
MGRFDEAETVIREVLDIAVEREEQFTGTHMLALALIPLGKYDEASEYLTLALADTERQSNDQATSFRLNQLRLAYCLARRGSTDEANRLSEEAMVEIGGLLAAGDWINAYAQGLRGAVQVWTGEKVAGENLLRTSLNELIASHNEVHFPRRLLSHMLVDFYLEHGRQSDADRYLQYLEPLPRGRMQELPN